MSGMVCCIVFVYCGGRRWIRELLVRTCISSSSTPSFYIYLPTTLED